MAWTKPSLGLPADEPAWARPLRGVTLWDVPDLALWDDGTAQWDSGGWLKPVDPLPEPVWSKAQADASLALTTEAGAPIIAEQGGYLGV